MAPIPCDFHVCEDTYLLTEAAICCFDDMKAKKSMKSFRTRVGRVGCIVTLALGGLGVHAAAEEDSSQREQDLMALIESLRERVTALEAQQAVSNETEDGSLDKRLEALETAVDQKEALRDDDFRVYWKKSLRLETGDGQAKLKLGGQIHNDWYWYGQDHSFRDITDQEDGTELRRARVYVSGTLYENLRFKAQYDFADGDADFKSVWIELTKVPGVQNIRVGQFKEPFSLEERVADNDMTFMERALPNAFAPSRNTGAMVHGAYLGEPGEARLTTALGVFRTTDSYGNDATDGGYAGTARVTGLPWYEDGGRRLLHLGLGYTHRNVGDTLRIRQRPESHGADRLVDTGNMNVHDMDAGVVEAALVYGPFSLQGEYFLNHVNTADRGDRDFDGFYVQASYTLTGEHRPYKNSEGEFGRIVPRNNFRIHGDERGWGAWEIALRYSAIDLDDGHTRFTDRLLDLSREIRGGEEQNLTVGLNWYLNPNSRVMLNYIHANIENNNLGTGRFWRDRDYDLDILQSRFQVTF